MLLPNGYIPRHRKDCLTASTARNDKGLQPNKSSVSDQVASKGENCRTCCSSLCSALIDLVRDAQVDPRGEGCVAPIRVITTLPYHDVHMVMNSAFERIDSQQDRIGPALQHSPHTVTIF